MAEQILSQEEIDALLKAMDSGEVEIEPKKPIAGYEAHRYESASGESQRPAGLDFILDIPLEITVELGRNKMSINDLLKLGKGSVVALTQNADATLEILANNRLIAKGDVVVIDGKYGIRLTEIISPVERLEKLR